MEFSSPLAAMRPQPFHGWNSRNETNSMLFPPFQPLGASFDFKTMSMHQQKPTRDYFNVKPVRGSSPTSSLTADLDANFHIDKSPQVATPRRALFTANVAKFADNGAHLDTPPINHESTPKFASSSPGVDMMDVSPLPHKTPHFLAQIVLPSPTPEETPEESMLSPALLSPDVIATLQPQSYLQLPERRQLVTRPSFTRTKGCSSSSVLQRPSSAVDQLPPFRFGNVATSTLASSSTPSLMDGFTESPIEMPSTSAATLTCVRRPSVGAASRHAGSPCSGHIRKSSDRRPPFSRPPRKQIRRSLSMFQHPDDVMKEEQEVFNVQPPLMSMVEIDYEYKQKLPHFIPDAEPDSLPRITQNTMVDILDNKYADQFSNVLVIDCRFEYEYEGGHIENAVNHNDKQLLADLLFAESQSQSTLVVLHCEYSVHRAPLTAKFIRNHDRKVNAACYPHLTYPEMYILDGGYSRFYAEHRSKCQPQNYVEMNDLRHEQACERGMAQVKQQRRQRLFRHQTFTCGQTAFDGMDSSPTQFPGRGHAQRSQSTFDVGPDVTAGIGETYQRRMASY